MTIWPKSVTMTLENHLAHMRHLMREGTDFERESALYHGLNWALTFTAMRTSKDGNIISIHPQPQLRLLGEPEQLPPRLALQLRSSGPVPAVPAITFEEELSLIRLDKIESELQENDSNASTHGAEPGLSVQYSSLSTNTGSSASSRIPQDSYRQPDFLSLITFPDDSERVMFLHEAKFVSTLLEDIPEGVETTGFESMASWFLSILGQAAEQAQFAFSQYPGIKEVHAMVTINFHFSVYRFVRERTPEYEEGQCHDWSKLLPWQCGPFPLINNEGKDYHRIFKRCWTEVKNRAIEG